MKRRLYYIFPDVEQTKTVVEALLLKHIPENHMHAIAREDVKLKDLPQASLLQKSDIKHSLLIGLGIGLVAGVLMGYVFHFFLAMPIGGLMVLTVFIGLILGPWFSTMIGMMAPNTELKRFQGEIDKGQILLIIDVPLNQLEAVREVAGDQQNA